MKTLSIGNQEREQFSITVLGYERSASGEFYDDNWLTSRVKISVGSFSGEFGLSLFTTDFTSFLEQLSALYKTLSGEAKFETMEGQIEFSMTGNGRGGVEVSGRVLDQAGIGNKLEFAFQVDQTYLPLAIHDLNEILNEFPARPA
ncbi:hypothetical protein [Geothrix terrae]|uniref:WapI family immunity protein n=1 Tax=Geothrix terrae TaxID=2922720 RepID=UPI001FABDEEC|nr:hypothetical protein [Geothrix terrae]